MRGSWRYKDCVLDAFILCCFFVLNSSFCFSLNDEGVALLRFKEEIVSDPQGALSNWIDEVGVENPCSWFGVGCSDGYVVVLNLKDLCLRGTIAPDVSNLIHIKSIVLYNNSFSGTIPGEVSKLKNLELLDLRYNNLSGQLPCHLGDDMSVFILLLDNNELLDSSSRDCRLSEIEENRSSRSGQASPYKSLVISRKSKDKRKATGRKLLQNAKKLKPLNYSSLVNSSISSSPKPVNYRTRNLTLPRNLTPRSSASLPPTPSRPSSSIPSPPTPLPEEPASSNGKPKRIMYAAIGGPIFLVLLATSVGIFCYRSGKVSTVKPWATGLSGQLQRAFVTGVPKLKRSELEVACEDFSNVIGSLTVFTLYKGTLSSGVEIAVASIAAASKKEWSSSLESEFRKKIEMLSKVNHKNFVNLLGYCEEEEPFTRMLVFEYAPNGTLFEHLQIKEAEHLDWETRLRIAMGIANCLDHMHNLKPPIPHGSLTSSSIYLSEDYAAKVSNFLFSDKLAAETRPTPQANVYSFGVLLLEMMTGKLPYSSGNNSLDDWASDYLQAARPLGETVDPTLRTYREDQLEEMDGVIGSCVNPDPEKRPSIREVCAWLRKITGLGPDGAIPKLSPLWWAELEIMSSEAI
ncbi:inactive receptor-like serine/threonine-protein kinase At2g40270 [Andrographis paniculata]|uniref:inactive receptor-like serine/threonine-protein kinase At2g40270 n=1 Tax=Andrographis paniculata TaxID=175694 RepID=UPI0021E8758E|nr:inactive receptor-like serine/threonine-protein kinase At2g40270 [Andrographis paniculata]